jgi:hypothetical protein
MLLPTHFLIIAVQDYNDTANFKSVSYAEKDATEIKEAFMGLGYDSDSFIVLLSKHATKATIEREVKKMARSASGSERIVIYFSGHGLRAGGKNLLASVDASHEEPEDTCVKLEDILGTLENADCERSLIFLDCCHSGFIPGEGIKSSTGHFSSDDLLYELKDSTYCSAFASCQGHETSISSPKLKNGVWSYFLKLALSGRAEGIYENGVLTSEKLQRYLRSETFEFVKKNRTDGKTQKPIQFGSKSDVFVVEDLTDLFAEEAARKKANSLNLSSVSIYDKDDGDVNRLPNFNKKKGHFVPDSVYDGADSFIKDVSGDLVKDEISELTQELQDKMDYSLSDLDYEIEKGYGRVETPDFIYSVDISQSKETSSEYIITRSIDTIVNEEIVSDPNFNAVFEHRFRRISFRFTGTLNLKEFILKNEALAKKRGIKLKYSIGDLAICSIIFPDSINEIEITAHSIDITTPKSLAPIQLIEEYKQTRLLLDRAELKLIN